MAGAWLYEAAGTPPDTEPAPETLDEWRARAVVSRFQAKAALDGAGLLDTIEAVMAHPETPRLTRLAWADAQEFRRLSPTVESMAAVLSLSAQQLDDLFRTAATIEA